MNTEISFRDKDLLVMKLLHYFIIKVKEDVST